MKVAFIDRDGTLIVGPRLLQEEPPLYDEIVNIDQLQVLPGVYEGLTSLTEAGYTLIMVSNQEGLGSDAFPKQGFENVQNELLNRLDKRNLRFEDVFICPHVAEDGCTCRKPNTGMVDDFIARNDIDMDSSVVIGDRDSDAEFARRIGVRFVRAESDVRFPLDELNAFISSSIQS